MHVLPLAGCMPVYQNVDRYVTQRWNDANDLKQIVYNEKAVLEHPKDTLQIGQSLDIRGWVDLFLCTD